MDILHQEHNGEGKFYTLQDGEQVSEMTYALRGNVLVILHTGVDDRLKGHGAGRQLLDATVSYARAHGLRIRPLCPYAKYQLDKLTEYHDVLERQA